MNHPETLRDLIGSVCFTILLAALLYLMLAM